MRSRVVNIARRLLSHRRPFARSLHRLDRFGRKRQHTLVLDECAHAQQGLAIAAGPWFPPLDDTFPYKVQEREDARLSSTEL